MYRFILFLFVHVLAQEAHEETDEGFKSISVEAQSRVYMPSVIWRQLKEERDWQEEPTDRLRDPAQNRSAPVEKALNESAAFGKVIIIIYIINKLVYVLFWETFVMYVFSTFLLKGGILIRRFHFT